MADPLNFAALQPQLSLADALKALASKGLDSPEKVAAVQRLASTPGAAEAYAAYDAAPKYQPITIGPPPITFTPPPQIVDRQAYLQQQQQQAAEAQRLADELKQQQAYEYLKAQERENNYQQARSAALGYADQATGGLASTVQRNLAPGGIYPRLGEQYDREQAVQQQQNDEARQLADALRQQQEAEARGYNGAPAGTINPADYPNPGSAAYAQRLQSIDPAYQRNFQPSGVIQTLTGAGTPFRAEIPYAKRVAEAAGDVAGGLVKYSPATAGANLLSERLPDVFGKDVSLSNVGATAIEALVPVEVWQAALELLPGVGTVPGVVSAIRKGSPEAIAAVLRASEKFGAREDVQKVLAKLASERGASKIPGKATGALPGGGEIELADIRRALPKTGSKLRVGSRVYAADRKNFGKVIEVNGDTARVFFRNPGGATAEVTLPTNILAPLDRGSRGTGARIALLSPDAQRAAWELLPPENQHLIGTLAQNLTPPADHAAQVAASRAAKASDIRSIFDDGSLTPEQKLEAAWRARKGPDAPVAEGLRAFFEPDQISSYYRQAADAVQSGLVTPNEGTNLGSIFALIFDGMRKNRTTNAIMPHERELLGRVFGPELETVLPKTAAQMSKMEKLLAPFQIWRSLTTGFELSPIGRQGRKVIFSDNKQWRDAIIPSLKSMKSDNAYDGVMDIVRNAEFYDIGQQMARPLGIVERGSGQVEEFLSPAIKNVRLLDVTIGLFERQYHAFLNVLRQGMFDANMRALIKEHGTLEKVPQASIQWVIDNINNATLYGNITWAGDYGKALGQTFFSARNLVSGPQFFGDMVRAARSSDPVVRKIAAKRFAGYVGSSVMALAGANLTGYALNEAGVPVPIRTELDPYSPSFGEMRVGPTKFNPWGTEVTLVRAALQAIGGQKTSEGEGSSHSVSRNKILGDTLRNKASPGAGVFADIVFRGGRDIQGRPIVDRPLQYAGEQVSPIFWKDVAQSLVDQGWWGTSALPQAFGADVQVYGATKTVQESNTKNEATDALKAGGVPFSGDEIDFKAPLLDYGDNRQQLAEQLGVDTAGKSMKEIRAAYVEEGFAGLMERDGISEPVARDRLGDYFDNLDDVKGIAKRADEDMRAYWKAHPGHLKQAIDAGKTEPADYKDEILRKADLLKMEQGFGGAPTPPFPYIPMPKAPPRADGGLRYGSGVRSPFPPSISLEQKWFSGGLAQMDADARAKAKGYRTADYSPNFPYVLGQKGREALANVIVYDPAASPQKIVGNNYYQKGKISAAPGLAFYHELTHAYQDRFVHDDELDRFVDTVIDLANGGDQFAQAALEGYQRNDGQPRPPGENWGSGAGDPVHLFTYFIDNGIDQIPAKLKPFYAGLFESDTPSAQYGDRLKAAGQYEGIRLANLAMPAGGYKNLIEAQTSATAVAQLLFGATNGYSGAVLARSVPDPETIQRLRDISVSEDAETADLIVALRNAGFRIRVSQ